MTETSKPSYKESDRDYLGALNAYKPVLFKAAIEGQSSIIAFPDDGAKRFYLECLKGAFSGLPIQIVAYSIVSNRAYFLIASWDQAPVSFLRYLDVANKRYSAYYNTNFISIGFVFKNKIRYKKIKKGKDIFADIAIIHSQPAATGLCKGYNDYEYTSYNEIAGSGLSTLLPLHHYLDKAALHAGYIAAHNEPPTRISACFLPLPQQDKFDIDFENCLIDFRCYQRNNLSKEIIAKIIIDLNSKSHYCFSFMVETLLSRKQEKYELLVMVVSEMSVRLRYTYDEALARLNVESTDKTLIKDIIIYINNELMYSYDYIMGILGLKYSDVPFYKELLDYMCDLKGYSRIQAMTKLGITDQAMLIV